MKKTILIEQTSKRIKSAEFIALLILFTAITCGLGLMYVSMPLGIAMFILAGAAFLGFLGVRTYRWWMHG